MASGYTVGNSLVTDNTKKILIFDINLNLIDVILVDTEKQNLLKNYELPKIFDGSTFKDSLVDVDDNFYDYYKKIE